jgi:DNA-directed RNA polymerase specialized sigma24 family protein
VDPTVTFDALQRLKLADDLGDPKLEGAWREVDRTLGVFAERARPGLSSDRHDARQITLLRVHRAVHRLEAREPASALAWLRTIYDRVLVDLLRQQKRRRELFDAPSEGSARSIVDELPAAEAEDPRIHDVESLAPFEAALFDVVEDLAARLRPQHRALSLVKAQLAYRRYVRQEPMEALHADAGDVSKDVLYQWLRRGRVQVLLPAVVAWRGTLDPESAEHAFAVELERLLEDADRADAGRPRPARRKEASQSTLRDGSDPSAVSPGDHCKSEQCDDVEDKVPVERRADTRPPRVEGRDHLVPPDPEESHG